MAEGARQEKPISLFYSYSHRDEELRKKLEDHLAGLRWSEKIAEWHDRNIDVGDEWAKEIDRNLTSADVILLLVSATFIASKYCWSVEMKKALERHDKGEAKVIPIILRPCAWHMTPFAKLQAAPADAKPVTSWSDPDEALYDVARKIERAVTDLQQQRRRAVERAQQQTQEARKLAEAKARQAAEEQKRGAQQRREQKEARRAVEAEARHPPSRTEAIKDLAVFRDIDDEKGFKKSIEDNEREAINQSGDHSRWELPPGVAAAIQKYVEPLEVYFAPSIPESKVQNVLATSSIPSAHGPVLGLIDLTLLGSSKNHIAFTRDRIYIHSGGWGFSGSLSYVELTKAHIQMMPYNSGVLVGEGREVDAGCRDVGILLEFFKELRRVCRRGK